MNKMTPLNITRRIIQIVAFIAMPGLFIETFAGMKAIAQALLAGTFDFGELSFQIFTVAAVLFVTLIAGRFFCGFLCAFGTMGDFASFMGRKLHFPQPKIPEKIESRLKHIKYALLVFIVLFIWVLGAVKIPDKANPWTVFGMYAKIGSWPTTAYWLSIGGAFLLMIFVASMFIPRFFCRYICPLGAVFAIVSKVKVLKIEKPMTACGGCRACTRSCPMALDLYKIEKVSSGECIGCMKCVDICPQKNAHIKGFNSKFKATIAAVICLCIMVGGYYGGSAYYKSYAAGKTSSSSSTETDYDNNSTTAADANSSNDASAFKDGTYNGTGAGYRGTTTVRVTVKSGKITNIEVVSYEDDQQWFERAVDIVINEIKNSQSVKVDTVSGATFSSNSIKAAVADALSINFTNPNDSAVN